MKKTKKFRDRFESDVDSLKQVVNKKKKKIHRGPKKQHFSKYAIVDYDEEE